MRCYMILSLIFALNILLYTSAENSYVLKAAKNVPRIGRSNNNNNNKNPNNSNLDQMGKFFMKASKSVPRIGRRNDESFDCAQTIDKRAEEQMPFWSDIADRFAYDPELLISPEVLEHLEMGDDPTVYNLDKFRVKRAAANLH